MLLKFRATVPILAVVTYFIVRIPTQSSAHPIEIISALVLVPAILAWGVTGLERVIREAQSTMERAISEELDPGPDTEPILITHEFQPVSEWSIDQPMPREYTDLMADAIYREAYPRLGGRHERTEVIPAVSE